MMSKTQRTLDARTRANLGRKGSAASGTHGDRRTRRNRDRSAQRRTAIREYA